VRQLSIPIRLMGTVVIFFSVAMAQTPVPIGQSTTLEENMKPGTSHEYALSLARGESAEIVIRQQGVDVVIDLISPGGKLLDTIDSPTGRNGDEVVEIIAQESGIYGLRVRPISDHEPAGSYRLEVKALRGTGATTQLLESRRQARDSAVHWLRPHSIAILSSGVIPQDLALPPFDEFANRVRVLGLGEATHGSREFGDLRLALTRRLIEKHGYRVVALEASTSRINQLAPYLNGDVGPSPTISRMFESGIWIGRRPRRELVEWLRKWNMQHPHDRVRLVGVDASDNDDSRARLGSFLERAYGADVLSRWIVAERELAAADEQTAVFGDSDINLSARQFVLEAFAMIQSDASILKVRFGMADVQAAEEAARNLAQFAVFNAENGGAINHSRDWFMAVNVLRAIEDAGSSSRAVYWAHNAHVASPQGSSRTTGALLRGVLGCNYGAMAVTFGEGAFVAQIPNDLEDRLAISLLPPAPDESIEGMLSLLRSDSALATWPCSVETTSLPEWLTQPHFMHWVGALYTPGSVSSASLQSLNLMRNFDGVVFLRRVTADEIPTDRPLIPARKR
jgi:erythromycin esterase